jgi:hypothetical protein
MTKSYRRYEVLLPLKFNDGEAIPDELIGSLSWRCVLDSALSQSRRKQYTERGHISDRNSATTWFESL